MRKKSVLRDQSLTMIQVSAHRNCGVKSQRHLVRNGYGGQYNLDSLVKRWAIIEHEQKNLPISWPSGIERLLLDR